MLLFSGCSILHRPPSSEAQEDLLVKSAEEVIKTSLKDVRTKHGLAKMQEFISLEPVEIKQGKLSKPFEGISRTKVSTKMWATEVLAKVRVHCYVDGLMEPQCNSKIVKYTLHIYNDEFEKPDFVVENIRYEM